jgi:hypothetical protein
MSRKICVSCGKRKNKKSFSKHKNRDDGLDTRCKHCVKKHSKIRHKLHKIAPSRPEVCECCGKVPTKNRWRLDHDHQYHFFRGWTCEHCNWGIGYLGDNIDGITKALNYLLAAQRRYLDSKK